MSEYNREEYAKTVKWDKMKCQLHPKKKAIIQVNPPIGGFFCKECYKELQIMRLKNMGVGF